MTEAETEAIYQRAREKWGDDAQIDMCIEECAELIQALLHLRRGRAAAGDVANEIADVQIMCEQVTTILGVHKDVAVLTAAKLARLTRRVAE